MALWNLAWVIMTIFHACRCHLAPRVSFDAGSSGRLLTVFTHPNITNTTTLLLGQDGETLFVGAKDAVISLDVGQPGIMEMKAELYWVPPDEDMDGCSMKGQNRMDCHNFIRVLQFLNSTHMYACGTFAFSPRCAYIDSRTFTLATGAGGKTDEGRGRCPYDPYQRNTAITVGGELYTSTVADYRGNRPVISRYLSKGSHIDLKLDDTLGWLEDPTFIGSFFIPSEEKVYFFFSEVGREYDFVEKFTVSRIAQVCTSDVGGQRTLQKRWTTFAKAQLLCQAESELPYSVLQDVVTLPPPEGASSDETMFYAIFSSQWSVNSGKSAVCAFRLGDVKTVFSGNYKVLNRDTLRWNTRLQEKEATPGECGLHNKSDSALRFVKENFLADDSVRPVKRGLALVSPDHRYSRIAAQITRGANGKDYTVLFLLTESGFLHKVVLLDQGPHIVEEVQVFQEPEAVNSLLLSITKGVVFVGTSGGVVQVPVSNCSYYRSCAQCLLSRDPFCAWDPHQKACALVSSIPEHAGQDMEGEGVAERCMETTITPKAKFGQARTPTGEEVLVSPNEVVTLRCPGSSKLASLHWEGPAGQLAPHLYLQRDDGALSFLPTALTLGPYLCYSLESGYRQNLALYAVKQRDAGVGRATTTTTATTTAATRGVAPTLPMSQPGGGTAEEGAGPGTEKPAADWRTAVPRETHRPSVVEGPRLYPDLGGPPPPAPPQQRSYYEELVGVSVALALALCLLAGGALCWLRHRCRGRAAPQVCPRGASEEDGPLERDPLTSNPAPTPATIAKQNGLPQSKPPAAAENGSLGGSNGHLPNTPI